MDERGPLRGPPQFIDDLFAYPHCWEVWHDGISPNPRLRPGVSPDHARRELLAHLRGEPDALPTRILDDDGGGDAEGGVCLYPPVRARDLWAVVLDDLTTSSSSFTLGVDDSWSERDRRIAVLLAAQ